ncbi:glycine-rich protein [Occultella gossypii]|uniref:receptor protein-tyrosine kinase n=1 Tax=Occultella gossypii TaxID=2800820 RepID=A0ABS7SAS4_9MICO|nr:glycine-rich protein [Occultella gossypii]MBZ2197449.1 hypothetical protein [Occultella gossypii]
MALLLALGAAPPAVAAEGDPCDGATLCTQTFGVTGAPQLWTVPDHITEVTVVVAGGAGGRYFSDGGAGGRAEAAIAVEPGQQLALVVGDVGEVSHAGGRGGYGGGAGSYGNGYGGGGGGGSFLFAEHPGDWDLLLAAGGGGGGARDSSDWEAYGGNGYGGAGGFTGSGPDADPAVDGTHVAGATVTAAGYGGASPLPATFDGTDFVPGQGQQGADTGGQGSGGGGGGYFGGAGAQQAFRGGGGGSGFVGDGITVTSESANTGPGVITIGYANLGTAAHLSTATVDAVAGEPISLTGLIHQFDAPGGGGTLTITATHDGSSEAIAELPVTTAGDFPYAATAETTFVPPTPGTYQFDLTYSGDAIHASATAETVTVTVTAAPAVRATTTILSADPSVPTEGQSVTLSALVTGAGDEVVAPAGA